MPETSMALSLSPDFAMLVFRIYYYYILYTEYITLYMNIGEKNKYICI